MMLGEKVKAEEAERLGMVYTVYSDDEFEAASKEIAFTLAAMPTTGLALTKKALQSSLHNSLTIQLALEDELQQQAAATTDFAEGVQAFVQKRKPNFTGN